MNNRRYLIVNADDFGYSAGVNRGILEAHSRGIVTSASLMVRQPAADEAAKAARSYPGLSLGLHIDLGEWTYCNGEWIESYRVVDLEDSDAVEQEIVRQYEWFCVLTGRKPTHLDSHQHSHRQEPVRSVLNELAGQYSAPVRHESPYVKYCGAFYGQTTTGEALDDAVSVESLIGVLRTLPAGINELGCHPGHGDDLDTMYARQRSVEVSTLCSPGIRAALVEMGIELISFHDLSFAIGGRRAAVMHRGTLKTEAPA